MFGGTPSNLALSCMNGGSVEVVAGINLPMLIKLASVRDEEALERRRAPRAGGRPQIHQRRVARPGRESERPMDSSTTGWPARLPIPEGAPDPRASRSSTARACTPAPRPSSCRRSRASTSDVTVTRCGETVGGRSIMGLLTLGAAQGTTITVTAKGAETPQASCLWPTDRRDVSLAPSRSRRGGNRPCLRAIACPVI